MASNRPETKVEQQNRTVSRGPTTPGQVITAGSDNLHLPHERDESVGADGTTGQGSGVAGERQRSIGRQAADDIEDGQVDTDMRATPGLDANKRGLLTGSGIRRRR